MAFQASGVIVSDAFANIRRQAAATKQYLQAKRTVFQQLTSSADHPISVIQHCATVLPLLAAWSAVPGLAEYARAQQNDAAYDVVAEYVNMRNALINLRDQLIAMFPKDGSGFLLYQTLQVDGSIQLRSFTSGQLTAAVTLIDSAIATIS